MDCADLPAVGSRNFHQTVQGTFHGGQQTLAQCGVTSARSHLRNQASDQREPPAPVFDVSSYGDPSHMGIAVGHGTFKLRSAGGQETETIVRVFSMQERTAPWAKQVPERDEAGDAPTLI